VPYIIRPPRRRKLATLVATVAVSLCAVPSLAQASTTTACPSEEAATQMLALFGDSNYYTLLPGSTFASGAPGWSLRGAAVSSERGAAALPPSSHALHIEPGGEAVSPVVCVSSEYPSFRLFAHELSRGTYGTLDVLLRWTDAWGYPHEMTSARVLSESSWSLTSVLQLGSLLPLWQPDATLKVRVVFKAEGWASYAIAGVFIDPYRK
jgi:hypothetical protein